MRETKRDIALLTTLARVPYLTQEHIHQLFFPSAKVRRVQRRCRLLFDHGYVDRMRTFGAAALPDYVYRLTDRGAAMAGVSRADSKRWRNQAPAQGSPRLLHHINLANLYVALQLAVPTAGCTIKRWRPGRALWSLPGTDIVRTEWVFVQHPSWNKPRRLPILPDAILDMSLPGGQSIPLFVEIEDCVQPRRVWEERALAFHEHAFAQQGRLQDCYGDRVRNDFRVLVVTTGRHHCKFILNTIADTVGPSVIFMATTFDQISAKKVLGSIWLRNQSGEPCSLLSKRALAATNSSRPQGVAI